MATQAEQAHAVSLIDRAITTAATAREVAKRYGLEAAAERLAWALDFLADGVTEAREGR